MREYKGKTIWEILKNLDPQKKETAERLRSIVKKTIPNALETIKWGNITYLLNGKNLAWIIIYKDHVDFGFFKGSKLDSKTLEGTVKDLRHIKMKTQDEIDEQELTKLLKTAAKLT